MPKLLEIVKAAPHVEEVFSREDIVKAIVPPNQDPRTLSMAQRF